MDLLNNEFKNILGDWVRAYPRKTINEVKKKIKLRLRYVILSNHYLVLNKCSNNMKKI